MSENKPERGSEDNTDDELEEALELNKEAAIPLSELIAKYGGALDDSEDEEMSQTSPNKPRNI